MGWIGLKSVALDFLSKAGADKVNDRWFRVEGRVISGMGDVEVVVDDDARYFVNGEPHPLAEDLCNATSTAPVIVF